MPDITMCDDKACPNNSTCYRHEASGTKPTSFEHEGETKIYQAYFVNSPRLTAGGCPFYWPVVQDDTVERRIRLE